VDLVSSRAFAAQLVFVLGLAACGGSGSGDAASSETSSGTETGTADSSESDSGESGTVLGTCIGYPTPGSKGDVFIAAGAASGNACEAKPSPCGGDPTGEWTLDASCIYDMNPVANPFYQYCPGASFVAQAPVRTGTLTVDASGHFELSMATVHDYTFGADITCLGVFDCDAEAEAALESEGGTASCAGDPFACDCTVTGYETDVLRTSGENALENREVLFADAAAAPLPYCVTDDRLEIWTLIQAARPKDAACADDSECAPDDDEILVCEA
jgi:hypothetical protein